MRAPTACLPPGRGLTPYLGTESSWHRQEPRHAKMGKDIDMRSVAPGPRGLWAAVVAGFLASVCCVGPLIVVAAGVGGAWVSDLTILDPIRPWLTVTALGLLGLAHLRYWRGRRPDARCACPPRAARSALWLWLGTALVAVALLAPYVLPALIVPSIPTTP